tara:strand:- start:373 stop:684 length:312 start_codon:yes stop_codon:yes gene_type:complete
VRAFHTACYPTDRNAGREQHRDDGKHEANSNVLNAGDRFNRIRKIAREMWCNRGDCESRCGSGDGSKDSGERKHRQARFLLVPRVEERRNRSPALVVDAELRD